MFEYDKTLILFGRSPFINKIAEYIPELCNKYHTMGCNYFVNSFPEVEYVVFYDDLVPKVEPKHLRDLGQRMSLSDFVNTFNAYPSNGKLM